MARLMMHGATVDMAARHIVKPKHLVCSKAKRLGIVHASAGCINFFRHVSLALSWLYSSPDRGIGEKEDHQAMLDMLLISPTAQKWQADAGTVIH